MFKKLATSGIGLLLLVSPVVSSADALSDLQAQIQMLLVQIAQLKAQAGQGTTAQASCINLSFNMGPDDTDADVNGEVTKLQKFLALDSSIYPEGRITGYFGPATTRAVQRWQKAHGLVSSGDPDSTGYGYVGPKTRGAMGCGGGVTTAVPADLAPIDPMVLPPCCKNNPINALIVSPTYGPAPLTVSFSHNQIPADNFLDYGDGSPTDTSGGKGGWANHVYANPGTYTTVLYACTLHVSTKDCDRSEVIGKATITVTQSSVPNPTISVTPSSGSVPLSVTILLTGLNLNGSTGPYALSFGDGSPLDYTTNSIGKDVVTHTYAKEGVYTLVLTARETWPPVASATITVSAGSGNGGGLSITFVSGNKSVYAPLSEAVMHLVIKGTELRNGSAATPDEGYNIQVYLTGIGDSANLQGVNATYNSQTGNWEADLTTPTNISKTYKVEASLYCGNGSLLCGQTYHIGTGNGQVSTSFNFTLQYPND